MPWISSPRGHWWLHKRISRLPLCCQSCVCNCLLDLPLGLLIDHPNFTHPKQILGVSPLPLQTSPGFYISVKGILFPHRPKYQSHPFLLSYPTTWNPCMLGSSVASLCNPMYCSPPDSSVHGISQVKILEGVAISSSRGSSRPRDQTNISCIGRQILLHGATWEAHGSHTLHLLA